MKPEDCDGCYSYELETGICLSIIHPDGELRRICYAHNCPCTECLIKMICRDACSAFDTARSLSHETR